MWGYHLNIGGGGYRHQADKQKDNSNYRGKLGNSHIHTALVSQIRYQIDTALRRARAEGHISNYSMAALESLFEVYKAMGGNGFVESEMEEIRKINQNGGK